MIVLFDIGHPAHVHLLRNTYFNLIRDGHKVIVTTRDIPSATKLMDIYGIPYILVGKKHDSIKIKALDQIFFDFKIARLVWKEKIDIGVHGIAVAHASRLSPMKSILPDDDDDEVEPLFSRFAHPFADTIISPKDTPRKAKQTLFVPSYHELAYLHPNHFTPDPSVLNDIKVKPGEPYFILRFNAFKAYHDVGISGITNEDKRKLVSLLGSRGKVFITTERNIDEEFKQYQLTVSPEKAHSLLYYATMLIGDSQTMTSEAAVLGTPAIRCNSFVGRIHYLEEEEHKYGLTYGFRPSESKAMFTKIEDLLSIQDIKAEWQLRRQKMLSEKIDYAKFLTWFIESYPDSISIMRENPDYQWRFR